MILLFLLIILFIILALIHRLAFYSSSRNRVENPYDIPTSDQYQPRRAYMRSLIEALDAVPCEHVTIQSFDNLTLHARFYPSTRANAPLKICCHGYRGSAIRDFCGGAQLAIANDHNVLLIDQRANGASEGSVISFGVNERRDVLSWIRYGLSRLGPDTPILLYGVSMGASTVIMCAEMDLPANVVGIVADCPFSSPPAIIRKVAADMRLPAAPLMPFAFLAARLFGHFDLSAASAVSAAKHSRIPILILHGEDDRFVPCDMSREIHAANPDLVTLETFPGAGHGLSYIVDAARYRCAVLGFEKTLKLL